MKSKCLYLFTIILVLCFFSDKAQAKESPTYVEIKISAAGDCTLGTDANFSYGSSLPAMYDKVQDPSYFLGGVAPIFMDDDLTIVNMEGTLTTNGSRADKTYAFRGDPSYTKILTQGSVEACNLANNHSRDYGEISYTDTIKYIEEAGIPTFGLGRTQIMDIKGIKVGLVGVYELPYGINCKDQLLKDIAEVKSQGAQLIITSFHWGIEREYYPEQIQIDLAHSAIDAGSDLVLGHHPHVLQGIERYRGKYIAYSLGNFCFGGNKNPSDKDSMIFSETFKFKDGNLVNTSKISRGLSGCKINLDNIKEEYSIIDSLEKNGVEVIPCRISSVTNYNDYRPTILQGDEKSRVISKLEEFSYPYY